MGNAQKNQMTPEMAQDTTLNILSGKITKKDVTIVFMILYIVGECREQHPL